MVFEKHWKSDERPRSSPSYRGDDFEVQTKEDLQQPQIIDIIPKPSPATKQYARAGALLHLHKDHHITETVVERLPQLNGWLQTMHDAAPVVHFKDILRPNWFWAFFTCNGFALQMWDSYNTWVQSTQAPLRPMAWWDVRRLHMANCDRDGKVMAVLKLFFRDGYLELKAASLEEAQRWEHGLEEVVHYFNKGYMALQETPCLWTSANLTQVWDKYDQSRAGVLSLMEARMLCHQLVAQERIDVVQRSNAGLTGNNLRKRLKALSDAQDRLSTSKPAVRELRAIFGDPVKKINFVQSAATAVFGDKAHLFTGADRLEWGDAQSYNAGGYGTGAYGDHGSRPADSGGGGDGCVVQ